MLSPRHLRSSAACSTCCSIGSALGDVVSISIASRGCCRHREERCRSWQSSRERPARRSVALGSAFQPHHDGVCKAYRSGTDRKINSQPCTRIIPKVGHQIITAPRPCQPTVGSVGSGIASPSPPALCLPLLFVPSRRIQQVAPYGGELPHWEIHAIKTPAEPDSPSPPANHQVARGARRPINCAVEPARGARRLVPIGSACALETATRWTCWHGAGIDGMERRVGLICK